MSNKYCDVCGRPIKSGWRYCWEHRNTQADLTGHRGKLADIRRITDADIKRANLNVSMKRLKWGTITIILGILFLGMPWGIIMKVLGVIFTLIWLFMMYCVIKEGNNVEKDVKEARKEIINTEKEIIYKEEHERLRRKRLREEVKRELAHLEKENVEI